LLPAASVNNSAENFELALRAQVISREGEHATPGYEFAGLTLEVLLQSFEPGVALVLNEYSAADLSMQVSL